MQSWGCKEGMFLRESPALNCLQKIINQAIFVQDTLLFSGLYIQLSFQSAFNIVPLQLASYNTHLGKHYALALVLFALSLCVTDEDHWLWQGASVCLHSARCSAHKARLRLQINLTSPSSSIQTPEGRHIERLTQDPSISSLCPLRSTHSSVHAKEADIAQTQGSFTADSISSGDVSLHCC